ncbi:hypothetical protein [Streptomyces sp. NPDC044948]|uniref:hypothetical protein n=1 Tax=Streptomyces sp. NPDC044948 TaxID=3157092 RepID=UPI0033C251C6
MTPAERRALLGDDVIAHIHNVVDEAPEPTPDVIETLRRIFTQPLGAVPVEATPAADAA